MGSVFTHEYIHTRSTRILDALQRLLLLKVWREEEEEEEALRLWNEKSRNGPRKRRLDATGNIVSTM